MITGVS